MRLNMRDSIKFALIGAALVIVTGLGWYSQNVGGVHDWFRSFGVQPLPADEIIVQQRGTAALPGVNGDVRVRVGDIERGRTATVEITGPGLAILATKQSAQVGDRIPFTHAGVEYQIEIVRYIDEVGSGDNARIRILH